MCSNEGFENSQSTICSHHHHHLQLINHLFNIPDLSKRRHTMGRPPCCDKSNVKRGLWTPEEDAKILAYVSNHGTGNWTLVPKKAGTHKLTMFDHFFP